MIGDDPRALPKLKPEIKPRWLEALRSNKYPQTYGVLHDAVGYCCLGVLCDIAKDDLGIKWNAIEINVDESGYEFEGCLTLPPTSVVQWAFEDTDEINCQKFNPLTLRNDGHGEHQIHSFRQIANIIERNM